MRNRHRADFVSGAAVRLERSARFVVEGLEDRVLLSAGDPDPTFGTGGTILLSDGTPSGYRLVMTTAVQADGKVLLAGSAGADQLHLNTFFLERLNSDGTPDGGFGAGGVVTASFGTGVAQGKSIAVQSDGSIVMGGTYEPDSTPASAEFAVARFTSTGAPDATFGTGGKVLTRIPGSEQLGSVSLAPGNKIVAVGSGTYQDPAHPTDAAYSVGGVVDVARYNSDGTPDTTFNGTGYAYLQSGQLSDLAAVGAVQADGRIVAAGNYGFNPVVYRFNVDGTLDTSFGLSGRAMLMMPYYSTDAYQSARIYKVVIQPNGQILLGGKGFDEGHNRYSALLARFNSDGWVDTSFGDDGLVTPPDTIVYGNYQGIGGLSVQTDGKIVLAGTAPEVGNYGGLWAARYLPNGSADPTFHSNEVAYYPYGSNQFGGVGAAMSPNGSIIIAGNVSDTLTHSGILLTRLQNDGAPAASASLLPNQTMNNPSGNLPGQLDGSFGMLGKTEFNNPSPVKLPDRTTFTVNATTVLASGKVLIAGSTGTVANNGQGQFFLRRLNADGTVDAAFGTNGSVVTSVGNYSWATSILVQTDGRIILGGASVDALPGITNANFALARYDADGTLDTTFGAAGKEITDFPGNEQVDSLAFGPGGTIVAAGSYFLYPNVGFDVARYTSGGLPDPSFNSTGMLQKSLGQTGGNSRATAVAVQSDGKVVVGSHSGNDYAVYRFNSGGSVDGGFGIAGVSTVNAALPPGYVLPPGTMTKLVIQPDGKIVAAGQTSSVYEYANHILARFNVDGSLDTGFGANGAVVISSNVPTSFQQKDVYSLAALILQADGEVLLVGNDRNPFGSDLGSPAGAPLVRKFLPNGTPDPYFTIDQDPWFMAPPPFYPGAPITGGALTPDGNLIVVANAADGLRWGGVARYLNDAHTITVSNLNDSGPGSLRAALDQAATSLPSSVIRFSPGLTGSINLATPIVESGSADNPVWIFGPGALNLSIHGRISVAGPVSVSGLTLFNGGIASPVSQSYTDSTIHGSLPASGSYLILRSSLLGDGTTATALSAGSSPHAPSKIDMSTITGYTSTAVIGGPYLDIVFTTISGNGGLGLLSNSSSLDHTIVAGNGATDVSGLVWSYGYNLIGAVGTSLGWISTDLTGTTGSPLDPQLLPLGYYFGPTPTMPPKQGSPAVGNGGGFQPRTQSATDQRGIYVSSPSLWDIGSVRSQYVTIDATSNNDNLRFTGGVTSNGTGILSVNLNSTNYFTLMTSDPLATLTVNGNGGSDTITLDYSQGGNALPPHLVLKGTFNITGLQGATPFSGMAIDVGRSTVYFNYAPGSDPAAAIRAALQAGYKSGTWTGVGTGPAGAITSSAAALDPAHYSVGYADSADGTGVNTTPDTVEIKYTVAGDGNLDGIANLGDVNIISRHFNATGAAWDQGDCNYDGVVNMGDVNEVSRNFNRQLAAVAAAANTGKPGAATAVPTSVPASTVSGSEESGSRPADLTVADAKPRRGHWRARSGRA